MEARVQSEIEPQGRAQLQERKSAGAPAEQKLRTLHARK